jgi:DNA modification methylase
MPENICAMPPAPTILDELMHEYHLKTWPPELKNWLEREERYYRTTENAEAHGIELPPLSVRSKSTGHWAGDRKQSTLWQIANMHRTQGDVDDGKTIHGTQKPVECMRRPILNNSRPKDAVYDPFLGLRHDPHSL